MSNALLSQVKQSVKAGKTEDQTKEKNFERTVTPEGNYGIRLVGYVEVGDVADSYQGTPKPPVRQAWLTFELLNKKLAFTVGEGDDAVTMYPLHREKIAIKYSAKATFTKLFKRMQNGRSDITHMAQMLGEAFRVRIVHNTDKEDVVWANARTDAGEWTISAPFYDMMNQETGDMETKPLPVAEPTKALQLLLWDDPTAEQWDSIYVDGEYTRTDSAGKDSVHSKNVIQEACLAALDFEGSAVQILLGADSLPTDLDVSPEDTPEEVDLDGGDVVENSKEVDMADFDNLDAEIPLDNEVPI